MVVPFVHGYWDSWPGRWQRRRTRRLRTVYVVIPGEPIQKGNRAALSREIEIRKLVDDALASVNGGTLTGPVALSLRFRTTAKQPPDLPKLAKFLLDALGASSPRAVGNGHPLYRDDRQVKMLHVCWSPIPDSADPGAEGSTRIIARPLRHVIEDLRIAVLLDDNGEDDTDRNPFASVELPDDTDPSWDDEWLPAELRHSLQRMDRWHSQRAILQHTGVFVRRMLSATPERVSGARRERTRLGEEAAYLNDVRDELDSFHDESWDQLLSPPFAAVLPSLPRQPDTQTVFNDVLAGMLHAFRAHRPDLVPLLAPLSVTIFVVPPQQGKDLDNIALSVLPTLHRVLQPPPPDSPTWVQSANPSSVVSYQVIELTHRPEDPPEGYLRVVLGGETPYWSDWDAISNYIDTREERWTQEGP